MRTRVLNHFHTFHPDAQAEHDRLALEEKRLARELARSGDDDEQPVRRRMSEPAEDIDAQLADVRAKIDEQKAIIASGVVRIVIKGLTRGEFRRLLTEHPPRDGDDLDAQLGYNSDTFGDALVTASIVRTENLDGEPVENEWATWADDMTNGQWEEVFTACLKLTNDGQPNTFPR
ncbi:MAG TPA: hypothetical protein VJ260_01780 [Vicinamibacterales bacterium]|nr:hypothetical protein [Vicinamibacterales bacterium]